MNDEFKMKGSLGWNPGSCAPSGNPLNTQNQGFNTEKPLTVRLDEEYRENVRKGGERPCVDCKHSRQVAVGNTECHRNAFDSRDVVTGTPTIVGWSICSVQRAAELNAFKDQYCGVEGRWFESKVAK